MTPAPVLRNREHQRQSRARRKTYVTELESRLRRYEEEGVRITIAVQAAARKVAEENANLRNLLSLHGISAAGIDNHLQGRNFNVQEAERRSPSDTSHHLLNRGLTQPEDKRNQPPVMPDRFVNVDMSKSARSPSDTESPQNMLAQHLLPRQVFPRHQMGRIGVQGEHINKKRITEVFLDNNNNQDDETIRTGDDKPLSCTSRTAISHSDTGTLERSYSRFLSPSFTKSNKPPSDETDCEHAARIIASMRGHEDAESLWPELGCSSERKCTIKNLAIFQMA